jgi:hypothetical protein
MCKTEIDHLHSIYLHPVFIVDNAHVLYTAEMMYLSDEQHNGNSKMFLPYTPMEASSILKNTLKVTVVTHTFLFL